MTHAELAAVILAAASQGGGPAADGMGVPLRALLATSGLCAALVFVVRRALPWLQARRERQASPLLEAAQRARQARQQARESEDRVRLLLDSTVEAICGLDLDGLVTFCNPAALRIQTRVNGVSKQDSNTRFMVFKLPRLIREFSAGTELEPGDIIITGTPEGVGFARKPPEFMKIGDAVEVEIEGIGVLRNTVQGRTS